MDQISCRMKLLLTGGSGFIGTHVLKALEQEAVDVVVIGRKRVSAPFQQIEADLLNVTDFSQLLLSVSATHMLHLAWEAEHSKYWTSPRNLRWVDATVRLVEAFCELGGKHVAIAGTCAEYDWAEGYCREDTTPLDPNRLYGISKDATRRLVMAICEQHCVPCAWGRLFLPYGHGECRDRLIPSLIQFFRGERAPFGINVCAYRDFLHASDAATGFIEILRAEAAGAFNVCSCQPVHLPHLVKTLASIMNGNPEPVLAMSTDPKNEPPVLIGENSKLKALGWRPTLDLEKGLALTLRGKCL
jgi:nucleoside-diphosphate-sugar epimerase